MLVTTIGVPSRSSACIRKEPFELKIVSPVINSGANSLTSVTVTATSWIEEISPFAVKISRSNPKSSRSSGSSISLRISAKRSSLRTDSKSGASIKLTNPVS